MLIFQLLLVVSVLVSTVFASRNVIASVRGKRFTIQADTVEEFTAKLESVVNLESGQQSVLFRGKMLSPTDILENVGVADGDVLMVVKGRKPRSNVDDGASLSTEASTRSRDVPSSPTSFQSLDDDNLPMAGMENAMKQMDSLLDSNVFEEYFKDDDTLEKARLQLLENIDQYEKAMPGFKAQAGEIASDPEKWRTAMLKAKEQISLLRNQREKFRAANPTTQSNTDSLTAGIKDDNKNEGDSN